MKYALNKLKITKRTWCMKQKIAELLILGQAAFDAVVAGQLRESDGHRLSEHSAERCMAELRKADIVSKHREGIFAGNLV